MKFVSIFTALLCAEAAIGARLTEKRRESRAARQLARRSSNGATRSSQPLISSDSLIEGVTNQSNVEYSTNWAGAVLISTGFTEVTGTVTVPTLTGSSSSATESAGSAVSKERLRVTGMDILTRVHDSGSVSMETLARLLSSRPESTGMLMALVCLTMLGTNGIRITHVSQTYQLFCSGLKCSKKRFRHLRRDHRLRWRRNQNDSHSHFQDFRQCCDRKPDHGHHCDSDFQ